MSLLKYIKNHNRKDIDENLIKNLYKFTHPYVHRLTWYQQMFQESCHNSCYQPIDLIILDSMLLGISRTLLLMVLKWCSWCSFRFFFIMRWMRSTVEKLGIDDSTCWKWLALIGRVDHSIICVCDYLKLWKMNFSLWMWPK